MTTAQEEWTRAVEAAFAARPTPPRVGDVLRLPDSFGVSIRVDELDAFGRPMKLTVVPDMNYELVKL